jgi:hypothetical protein
LQCTSQVWCFERPCRVQNPCKHVAERPQMSQHVTLCLTFCWLSCLLPQDSYNITVEHAVDGSSGTEFVIAMSGYASRESVLRAVFAQLDHEGSGHVDKHKFDIAIDKLVGAHGPGACCCSVYSCQLPVQCAALAQQCLLLLGLPYELNLS